MDYSVLSSRKVLSSKMAVSPSAIIDVVARMDRGERIERDEINQILASVRIPREEMCRALPPFVQYTGYVRTCRSRPYEGCPRGHGAFDRPIRPFLGEDYAIGTGFLNATSYMFRNMVNGSHSPSEIHNYYQRMSVLWMELNSSITSRMISQSGSSMALHKRRHLHLEQLYTNLIYDMLQFLEPMMWTMAARREDPIYFTGCPNCKCDKCEAIKLGRVPGTISDL